MNVKICKKNPHGGKNTNIVIWQVLGKIVTKGLPCIQIHGCQDKWASSWPYISQSWKCAQIQHRGASCYSKQYWHVKFPTWGASCYSKQYCHVKFPTFLNKNYLKFVSANVFCVKQMQWIYGVKWHHTIFLTK
jgi:hypothetical protein